MIDLRFRCVFLAMALWIGASFAAAAGTLPPLTLKPLATEMNFPLYATTTGVPGDERIFVVEKAGVIRIIENGALLPTPFLEYTGRVQSAGSEQGMLGLVFDPDYATNGFFYVNHTGLRPNGEGNLRDTRIVSFSVSTENPNVADAASAALLLEYVQPEQNHNAGWIGFGPDGYLYIPTGDGGGGGDGHGTIGNGQDLTALLGKILRIGVNGPAAYTIPEDNPMIDNGGEGENFVAARPEIWAYGLRNPYRNSFDRTTGDFYIADVGQLLWEEINRQPAASTGGENYGWRLMEGFHCYNPSEDCDTGGLTDPIHEYSHDDGRAVIGGYVYRGNAIPELDGRYFFGDYNFHRIWSIDPLAKGGNLDLIEHTAELDPGIQTPSFGEDADGELLLLSTNAVYRVIRAGAEGEGEGEGTACGAGNPDDTADYRLTFDGLWSAETHPLDFPNGAHLTTLAGAAHNGCVEFWSPGTLASPGTKSMAETGATTVFKAELDASDEIAFSFTSPGLNPSPGQNTFDFTADAAHPLITILSMIAPSPDWFIGVDGLSLRGGGGWMPQVSVDLLAYDAGTDSGGTYGAQNFPTAPPDPVTLSMLSVFNDGPTPIPVGRFTFTRTDIAIHTADQDGNNEISLSELLRVIQFFNSDGFHCQTGTEDGYAVGPGDESCAPHGSDYNPQDWEISLSEVLRVIQFFNLDGYYFCPGMVPATEDSYCPGPQP